MVKFLLLLKIDHKYSNKLVSKVFGLHNTKQINGALPSSTDEKQDALHCSTSHQMHRVVFILTCEVCGNVYTK